ncbi:PorH family porin [Corynebacterium nasicanis]|uniref:PorH family porin n=1 Tax=Corynebacterium nasicanis TaxID=1448267 RepID=A0ABW1QDD7_9CORY
MDLDIIQENLGNFATFGKNIGTALQSIPALLKTFFEFFGNLDNLSDNTRFASSLPVESE